MIYYYATITSSPEYQQCGGPTREWVLTDLANSSQLGTSQRVREKMVKMTRISTATPVTATGGERMEEKDRRIQVAEIRAREAEREKEIAVTRRQEAERREEMAETRRQEAERREEVAETRRQEAETRRQEAERERDVAQTRQQEAERREEEAERNRIQQVSLISFFPYPFSLIKGSHP